VYSNTRRVQKGLRILPFTVVVYTLDGEDNKLGAEAMNTTLIPDEGRKHQTKKSVARQGNRDIPGKLDIRDVG